MYNTKQDMIDAFGSDELETLTDRDNIGAIDDAVLNKAIAAAAADINSLIGISNTLPLVSTPAVLVNKSCDITRFLLSVNRTTEEIENRYKDTMKWLQKVADGKATLGLTANQEENVSRKVSVAQSASGTDWGTY